MGRASAGPPRGASAGGDEPRRLGWAALLKRLFAWDVLHCPRCGPCGSSIATAATMSKVCYPSLKRFGYADYLSAGSIAAGGTLGILIPPSTITAAR